MKISLAPLFLVATLAVAEPWQGISALAVSPDGRLFVTGGRDGEVMLWETSTGEIQGRWLVGALPVAGIAFSPDGVSVGVITLDAKCSAIKLTDGTVSTSDTKGRWKSLADAPAKVLNHNPVTNGTVASWKDVQARGGPDGIITVTLSGGAVVTWQAHEAAVTAMAFLPNGELLSACYDGTVARWDVRTGRALGRL